VASILVLLALLSVAALAARQGAVTLVTSAATTTALLAMGFAVSPHALAFLPPSAVHSLDPALLTGLCWLGIVIGDRALSGGRESVMRAVGVALPLAVAGTAIAAVATIAVGGGSALPPAAGDEGVDTFALLVLVGGALLVGATTASAPATAVGGNAPDAGDIVGALIALVAFFVVRGMAEPAIVDVLMVLGAGVGLALVLRMVAGTGDGLTLVIAALGVAALAAGAATALHVPVGLVGVVIGLTLSRSRAGIALRTATSPTEKPVRYAVAFLIGMRVVPDLQTLAVGVILGASLLVLEGLLLWRSLGARPSGKVLAERIATQTAPLVWAPSVVLATLGSLDSVITIVAVTLVLTDIAAVALRLGSRSAEETA
jgi:hypothetical protein